MKKTIKEIKDIVKSTLIESDLNYVDSGPPHNLKVITPNTLKKIAPKAFKALKTQLSGEDTDPIWIMTEKPQLVRPGTEEHYFTDEVWTQTNEIELAEWLSKDWDQFAINVDGQQIVILNGTYDDEYGNFWNASAEQWENYAF